MNHQMDIDLFNEIGREFKKRFEGKEINKILTIEASGIGIGMYCGAAFSCAGRSLQKNLRASIWKGRCLWQR